MSEPTRTAFGAPNTHSGRDVALNVFHKWQVGIRNDPPLDELTDADVENDNLEGILTAFGTWMADMPIPQANKTGKFLSATSKGKYYGHIKESFKDEFP